MKKVSRIIAAVGIGLGLVLLGVGALIQDYGSAKAFNFGVALTIIGPIMFLGSLVWKSKQKSD